MLTDLGENIDWHFFYWLMHMLLGLYTVPIVLLLGVFSLPIVLLLGVFSLPIVLLFKDLYI